MPTKEVPAAPVTFTIPDDVLAYCRKKGITDDFEKALGILRDFFPDLRKVEILLEEHEVLDRKIVIRGEAPGAAGDVAQRIWDCVGRWVDALPRGAMLYFQLGIHPEGE